MARALVKGLRAVAALWLLGAMFSAPYPQPVGGLPPVPVTQPVAFDRASGSAVQGWFIPGKTSQGAVALMHGYRATRLDMWDRACFLANAGFSVLIFDFQAHGESPG